MVITIIEGGEFAKVLARILLLLNHTINVIIQSEAAQQQKMNELELNLILGKGTDTNILAEPFVLQSDIVIALMDKEVDNLLSCLFIKERNSTVKTIMRAGSPKYVTKYEELGIDIVFNSESALSGLLKSTS